MPNSDQLVITGGQGDGGIGISRVQVYTVGGAKEQLPDLNQPRRMHACGYFYNSNNNLVITLFRLYIKYKIIFLVFSQVYLVTGGDHKGQTDRWIDSTELLTKGDSAWVFSGVLPSARHSLMAASLDNKLIVTGT